MPDARPAYATRRNPNNPTFGARVAMIADTLMGTPLMPWQRQVADVALEIDPDRPGAWRYDEIVVTVPRQAGKTALMRAVAVDRLMAYRNHIIMMTAQTGKDARKRWDQILKALEVDRHPSIFKAYASRGSEQLLAVKTESTISPFAPTPTAVHGDSLHLVMIDEAWAHDEESGQALTAAINPTFATVLDSQLWVVSTKGTARSAYLNNLIDRGRQAVDDPGSHMAYFEWSADPDQAQADPYSRQTLAFHPALGHTQSYEKLLAIGRDESLTTWKRSYLNLTDPGGQKAPIDLALWDDLAKPAQAPSPSQCSLAFDAALDGSAASIAIAWRDAEITHTAIAMTQPGAQWLTSQVSALYARGYTRINADPTGPTRTIIDDLARQGIPVNKLTTSDYSAACQWLIDKSATGDLAHDGTPMTRQALELTATSTRGGTLIFNAARSMGPIDALRATAIAGHDAATRPAGLQIF